MFPDKKLQIYYYKVNVKNGIFPYLFKLMEQEIVTLSNPAIVIG
jgi:hypothetical protein